MVPPEQRLTEVLALFGKKEFRPGQESLIRSVLAGHHALGVLPTGHGKSLCYQAAAYLLGGTSLVVSPLIALMREQSDFLNSLNIPAARFDSTLMPEERRALLKSLATGAYTLLFVAPESLENPELLSALAQVKISLFVVDEAHCVSEWGHSFRPDYLRLPAVAARLNVRSVLALTATATLRVQEDLCRAFSISPEHVVALSPYRPNITRLVRAAEDRSAALREFLDAPGHLPAIVYTRSRKGAEQLAGELAQAGYAAACYHAGQPTDLRAQLQDDFLCNNLQVLVATIAFGMGVDKPDVHSVIHYDVPSSPESYLQESGRAGRDGAPSFSLVLLHPLDLMDAANRICAAEPDTAGVLRAVRWLVPPCRRVVSLWEVGTLCDVPADVLQRAMFALTDSGAVEIAARGSRYYKVRPLFPLATITDGRSPDEVARLSWLDKNREGAVEDAALAWDCTFAEAMEQLRECEAAGEWRLTFRQQALELHRVQEADPVALADELSAAYALRRSQDEQRLELMRKLLTGTECLNAALTAHFTGAPQSPCGHCFACRSERIELSACPPPPPLPPENELPEFDRPAQRARFLLGISSPASLARRWWAHPHHGAATGTPWQDLF